MERNEFLSSKYWKKFNNETETYMFIQMTYNGITIKDVNNDNRECKYKWRDLGAWLKNTYTVSKVKDAY